MQTLFGFTPLAGHVVRRRRRILVGEADVDALDQTRASLSASSSACMGANSGASSAPPPLVPIAGGGDATTNSAPSLDVNNNSSQQQQQLQTRGSKSKGTVGGSDEAIGPNKHAKKNHVPTAAEIDELRRATVFAKDGYVVRPSGGAAGVAVWVPRGWRCEEAAPAWNAVVLTFKPSAEALQMAAAAAAAAAPAKAVAQQQSNKGKGGKGKNSKKGGQRKDEEEDRNASKDAPSAAGVSSDTVSSSPSLFSSSNFISALAAADPVACLRLTIQDNHAEVGEQTAAEYVSDAVGNIYRDQTRFIAAKYKVAGPKVLMDRALSSTSGAGGGGGGGSDTGGATTTTDDDEGTSFGRYQRMFGGGGGGNGDGGNGNSRRPPTLVDASPAGTAAAAVASASAFSNAPPPKVAPRVGSFSNILSYTTTAVIGQRSGAPRRVHVSCTSLVLAKGPLVYSFELQSSPPNHATAGSPSFTAVGAATAAIPAGGGGEGRSVFADPAAAGSSWVEAFFQMAQVMAFGSGDDGSSDNESEDSAADDSCASDDESAFYRRRTSKRRANPSDEKRSGTAVGSSSAPPKGTIVVETPLTAEPHCAIEAVLRTGGSDAVNRKAEAKTNAIEEREEEGEEAPYFMCTTPALWTPSLMGPSPFTGSASAPRSPASVTSTIDGRATAVFRPLAEQPSPPRSAPAASKGEEIKSEGGESSHRRGTTVVPLAYFATNSEAFPARVELYLSRVECTAPPAATSTIPSGATASGGEVGVGGGSYDAATASRHAAARTFASKLALVETIAALGMQRSYTSAALTLSLPPTNNDADLLPTTQTISAVAEGGGPTPTAAFWPSLGAAPQGEGRLVTVTPCQVVPPKQNPFEAAMGVPAAGATSLPNRRVAVCPLHYANDSDNQSSTVVAYYIVAVEVPLRRNVLKTPAVDLARAAGSVVLPLLFSSTAASSSASPSSGGHATPLCCLIDAIAGINMEAAAPSIGGGVLFASLSRRLVSPALGVALMVGDGCQCLASPLRPEVLTVAVRPCRPYYASIDATTASDGGVSPARLVIIPQRSANDSLFETTAVASVAAGVGGGTDGEGGDEEVDEGLLTVTCNYTPPLLPPLPVAVAPMRPFFAWRPSTHCGGGGGTLVVSKPASPTVTTGGAVGTSEGSAVVAPSTAASRASVAASAEIPTANADMTAALTRSVAALACELAEEAEGLALTEDSVTISDWLTMVGGQRCGVLRQKGDGDGRKSTIDSDSLFARLGFAKEQRGACRGGAVGGNVPNAAVFEATSTPAVGSNRELAALQAHLRSATDPANGAFVTMQTACDVAENKGVIIKAVSPNFALFRRHRGLLMDHMLPSIEFV